MRIVNALITCAVAALALLAIAATSSYTTNAPGVRTPVATTPANSSQVFAGIYGNLGYFTNTVVIGAVTNSGVDIPLYVLRNVNQPKIAYFVPLDATRAFTINTNGDVSLYRLGMATNATPPSDAATIQGWIDVTNTGSGGLMKVPVYK